MILVSYDISNNKTRTRFAKYLQRFGHRMQYSLFEIDNGERFLREVESDINGQWSKLFKESDSVIVFNLSKQCKITRYGYSIHDDEDFIII